ELLGLQQVSRHDNFFEVGGHSLIAVRLLSRLAQTVGVTVSLASLFAHPTLAALALALTQTLEQAGAQTLPAIVPAARDGQLPLSFAQQRLWFLAQL
ncbi:phosphopantetheine-binding protein, partial [Rhodanobacter sp. DHG33]|uniref:phosphopantetheine-binding protein n=1 Tax=Rhodanobacter sp. DHG33 TaxID=2775921 RepID=UPI00178596BE